MKCPAWLDVWFISFSALLSRWAGSPLVFAVALLATIAWALCGPLFDYSDGWMLVINTATTIVTFLMVFIIQNSQNREGLAAQIKLDEIIRAIDGARNGLINLEDLPPDQMDDLRAKFAAIGVKARKRPRKRISTAKVRQLLEP